MANKPKVACKFPGCPNIIPSGTTYCEDHKHLMYKDRPSGQERGYDAQWKKVRALYIKQHPLCEECLKNSKTVLATKVHHIIPAINKDTRYDFSNLMALCDKCHGKLHSKQTKDNLSKGNKVLA